MRKIRIASISLFSVVVASTACGPPADSGADMGAPADGGSPGDSGAGCDGPCDQLPAGLLDPDYTTTWNPGILTDTPTGNALGDDSLPVRTTTCASVAAQSGDATVAIEGALNGCTGKHQVVALAAGKFTVSATLT